MDLEPGIPRTADYRALVASPEFREMEAFSEDFLRTNREALRRYRRRWVEDPFHQWSRQWEYPFVLQSVRRFVEDSSARRSPAARILDAGSGITFYPFLLASVFEGVEVCCCDRDAYLGETFRRVRGKSAGSVRFERGELQDLPFEDNSLDVVDSISVLEHTGDYERVASEIERVLRPGGLFVATFDISLDGEAEVSPEEAARLLETLSRRFVACEGVENPPLGEELTRDDLLTTVFARDSGLSTRPWRYPLVGAAKSLARGRIPRTLFKNLTCYCAVFEKGPEV